eukprot:TRINITY_DN8663_c0_g1_i1.p1 TRINITY_DN8663_c0_g1~~TRINITY_DN8663_c0_g1_i1.p1  ORF type:complete len:279 (+),score=53.91 TRINITY_DN8663_c0_g1_i1:66-902(+)
MQMLIDAIGQHTYLQHLNLAHNRLTDESLDLLWQRISRHSSLRRLDVAGNRCSAACLTHLAHSLSRPSALAVLSLPQPANTQQTALGDYSVAVAALVEAVGCSSSLVEIHSSSDILLPLLHQQKSTLLQSIRQNPSSLLCCISSDPFFAKPAAGGSAGEDSVSGQGLGDTATVGLDEGADGHYQRDLLETHVSAILSMHRAAIRYRQHAPLGLQVPSSPSHSPSQSQRFGGTASMASLPAMSEALAPKVSSHFDLQPKQGILDPHFCPCLCISSCVNP